MRRPHKPVRDQKHQQWAAMHWLLTPYDRHSDDGFGAMATAFKASAETLLAAERERHGYPCRLNWIAVRV